MNEVIEALQDPMMAGLAGIMVGLLLGGGSGPSDYEVGRIAEALSGIDGRLRELGISRLSQEVRLIRTELEKRGSAEPGGPS